MQDKGQNHGVKQRLTKTKKSYCKNLVKNNFKKITKTSRT